MCDVYKQANLPTLATVVRISRDEAALDELLAQSCRDSSLSDRRLRALI